MATKRSGDLNKTVTLLRSIWETQIQDEYKKGLISNEACLQSALYHHIRRRARDGVEVFLGIKSFLNSPGIPDIIVAKDLHVEAVMELKMVKGNRGIVYQRDLDKLMGWYEKVKSKQPDKDWLRINPCSTDFEKPEYTLDCRTAWIFAAVGKNYCYGLDHSVLERQISKRLRNSGVQEAFKRSFLHFTGIIYKDPKPAEFVA
jgi:hypothetical protein